MIPGFWQHALAVERWRRTLTAAGYVVVEDAIVWLGTRASFRMLWTMRAKGAGEETFDAHGLTALRALCKLDALGMTLDEFQRAHGLTADEDCGPKTLAAMGIA